MANVILDVLRTIEADKKESHLTQSHTLLTSVAMSEMSTEVLVTLKAHSFCI